MRSLASAMPTSIPQAWHGSHSGQVPAAQTPATGGEIRVQQGSHPTLKAIPKEPLSEWSVFSSLSVDSSLLISWGLWLKTAVHSFTFNYSPAEGLLKKKIQTSKITAEEKKKALNNLFIMLLRQSHVLLGYGVFMLWRRSQ